MEQESLLINGFDELAYPFSSVTLKLLCTSDIDHVAKGEIVLWRKEEKVLLVKVNEVAKTSLTSKFEGNLLEPDGVETGKTAWFSRTIFQSVDVYG